MKVNKKKLAEIFNVDPRTIERWQSQGLPCVSGGSKGVESVFDTAMAIQWYAQREADIENENSVKRLRITGLPARQISSLGLLSTNAIDLRVRRPTHRS